MMKIYIYLITPFVKKKTKNESKIISFKVDPNSKNNYRWFNTGITCIFKSFCRKYNTPF